MKPTEFYGLPALDSRPWHEDMARVELLFAGEGVPFGDLDLAGAASAGAGRLTFERKLSAETGFLSSVDYASATFAGSPFAILVSGNRLAFEPGDRTITDIVAYRRARAYVEAWVPAGRGAERDLADPAADLPVLSGTRGHVVVETGGRAGLVKAAWLARDGRPMFDQAAFNAAFRESMAAVFQADGAQLKRETRWDRMSARITEAVLLAVPSGVRATGDFGRLPAKAHGFAWASVVLAGDEGTYVLGIRSWEGLDYLAVADKLDLVRVGPPDMFDGLVLPPVAAA